jgi:Flp pilus assembly CpaE family ATPase
MSGEQLGALLGSLARLSPWVLLDLGSTLDELTLAALEVCEQIVLVMDPQRIALAAARNVMAQLERQGVTNQRLIAAVINRSPGVAAPDKRAIETQLNLPVSVWLPPAPDSASQAVQDGALRLAAAGTAARPTRRSGARARPAVDLVNE